MSSVIIIVLTLWIAVITLALLVVRVLGWPKVKRYPGMLVVLILALLAAPAGGLFKAAQPVYARVRPYLRRVQSEQIVTTPSCTIFPADNVWNASARNLPVLGESSAYVSSIGIEAPLHADFGARAGYQVTVVNSDIPPANVMLTDYAAESDPGPYRIPDNASVEATEDRHQLTIDLFHCQLYELFGAVRSGPGQWQAVAGAIYDLRSNKLRPANWTAADAAGLPMTPGLVRLDEVRNGRINHALRFTARNTRNAWVWPARHKASSQTDPSLPPMGQRFRLRATVDKSRFSPQARVILTALQEYGMLLADNGGNWFLSGVMDSRWPSSLVAELKQIHGDDFDAVDSSPLMVDPNSGQARQ